MKTKLYRHIMKNKLASLEFWKAHYKTKNMLLDFDIWSAIFLIPVNKTKFLRGK